MGFKWFFIVWYVLNIMVVIDNIGRTRDEITSGKAAFSTLIYMSFIAAIYSYWK